MWLIVAGVLMIGAVAAGPVMSDVEQATYDVVESQGDVEIRDYAPMIVAQTEVSGERKAAISEGFRTIADYIFGNNTGMQKIAMTAPVIQQEGQKIAMTAPVIQQGAADRWKVRFVMPSGYTLDTLPKPHNARVKLLKVPGKRFVVIRFSGVADEDTLKEQTEALHAFIRDQKLAVLSQPSFAFFNPPWTLPLLRRNEVMVEIAR